jgi:hypothetical protein
MTAAKHHPRVLDLLEAAMDIPTPSDTSLDDRMLPRFDPAALLALADWLEEQQDPRAADVRELGSARYFLPLGDPDPHPRPIAGGPWWNVSLLHTQPDRFGCCFHVSWRVYPGTEQYRLLHQTCLDEEWSHNPSFDPSSPMARVPTTGILRLPGETWSYRDSDTRLLRYAFERFRFGLAAGLLGASEWRVECRAKLLRGDDHHAADCLAFRHPPAELVRQLRQLDRKRFRRLKARAARESARFSREVEEEMRSHGQWPL